MQSSDAPPAARRIARAKESARDDTEARRCGSL